MNGNNEINTNKDGQTKKPTWLEWYEEYGPLGNKLPNEKAIENLCHTIKTKFRTNPENYWSLEAMIFDLGIPYDRYNTWVNKIPALKAVHQWLKLGIGVRREAAAIKGEAEKSTIHFTQGHYSKTWRYEEDRKTFSHALAAKLLAEAQQGIFNQEAVDMALAKLKEEGYDFGDDPSLTTVRRPSVSSKPVGKLQKTKP